MPLPYQPENNDIPVQTPPTGFDALRTIAVSRSYRDNPECSRGWRRWRCAKAWTIIEEHIFHMAGATSPPRKGHRTTPLHLWTRLMDPLTAPALELVELYGKRWEHELFYRQLKLQLRKSELLQSHTVETGAQEIAALLMAAALIASERAKAAGSERPALRISFVKLLELLRP